MRRLLFLVFSGILGVGCLDTPPTYEAETQIPPFIISAMVQPPLGSVYPMSIEDQLRIVVPFLSEDLGESLVGYILVDERAGPVAPSPAVGPFFQPPSTFSDTTRSVSEDFTLPTGLAVGCHTVTLVLTYESNMSLGVPLDEYRTARAVWWVNILGSTDAGEQSSPLEACPTTGGQ
jgi:hypothetical protein